MYPSSSRHHGERKVNLLMCISALLGCCISALLGCCISALLGYCNDTGS